MSRFETLAKKKKETLVIVDLNNLLHKAVAVNPYLSCKKDEKRIYTGGLYGTISQIAGAVRRYNADSLVICMDAPPYIRSQLFPCHKSDRKEVNEDKKKKLDISRKLITEYFTILGVPILKADGYEADDIIYHVCEMESIFKDKIILSGDKDLYQIFEIGNHIRINTGAGKVYNKKDFKKKFDMSPWRWPWVSALSGGHNGLPGFKGIGEISALGIAKAIPLQWKYDLPKIIDPSELCLKGREKTLFEKIDYEMLITYYRLCRLPLKGLKINSCNFNGIDDKSIKQGDLFLRQYGFKSREEI